MEKIRTANGQFKEIKKDFSKLKDDLIELTANTVDRGKQKYSKAYVSIEKKISKNPLPTLLGVLGAGLVLGYWVKRKTNGKIDRV